LRSVPNGLGLFVEQGSGVVVGYNIKPVQQDDTATRVFPGLSRSLIAKGHDETGYALPDAIASWSSSDTATVTDHGDGTATVVGVSSGTATVTAASGAATGSVDLQVLGELERIELAPA